jgi:hypothetical protein
MIRNRNKKRKKSEKSKEKKGKKKKTQIEMAAIEGQSSRVKNHMLCSSSPPPSGDRQRGNSIFGQR